MQLIVTFTAPGVVSIPVHHGHLLQALIYNQMDNPTIRHYLHEHGFLLGKRHFKLFTFSRLQGRELTYEKESKRLIFTPPLRLVICSPLDFLLQELGTGFLRQGKVRIGEAVLEVQNMSVDAQQVLSTFIRVCMLSPLVVYSTLEKEGGDRYVYYYTPFEERFSQLVGDNLKKKYLIVHGNSPYSLNFNIRPLRVREKDFKVTYFKDTIVKGWMGDYELEGEPKLLQLALDAGLGSKNSQGYGCCKILEEGKTDKGGEKSGSKKE